MARLALNAVKKVSRSPVMGFTVHISPNDLKSLRLELSESLTEFGITLKRAIDPRSKKGFSRQYISRLEHGEDAITPEIKRAFLSIAATLDGVPSGLGGAVEVMVLAAPEQVSEGTFIPVTAKVIKCARPGCPVWFVRVHPRQIYHDVSCRLKSR